jgi:hypothetical protein
MPNLADLKTKLRNLAQLMLAMNGPYIPLVLIWEKGDNATCEELLDMILEYQEKLNSCLN